ncbi:hypothetical protein GVO57_06900 [Sphingomonas changnyeongensis]|uniref:TonB-dependent receptor plug domain-containing protein n=1 Tax=Sphingomonas changnyeongensis TaxID=2698679 RepID=A0A7Z2NVJ4_9SPHN|nr:hypothetical protein [Sphingomonas changnyeongensis]QHL90606.1 hypothetical protein GVO57_06900 [Sphingomonas changnyeongensis]
MKVSLKLRLLAGASMIGALAGTAQAQVAPPAPAETADNAASDEREVITVTGSRIQRDPNATAPLPISSLSADALRAAGNNDVTATLRQIPALLASTTVADSIERGGPASVLVRRRSTCASLAATARSSWSTVIAMSPASRALRRSMCRPSPMR